MDNIQADKFYERRKLLCLKCLLGSLKWDAVSPQDVEVFLTSLTDWVYGNQECMRRPATCDHCHTQFLVPIASDDYDKVIGQPKLRISNAQASLRQRGSQEAVRTEEEPPPELHGTCS